MTGSRRVMEILFATYEKLSAKGGDAALGLILHNIRETQRVARRMTTLQDPMRWPVFADVMAELSTIAAYVSATATQKEKLGGGRLVYARRRADAKAKARAAKAKADGKN